MNMESARTFLLWCLACNYAVPLVWFLLLCLGRDWVFGLHGRWFSLARERFDSIHYAGMAGYKIAILSFNLAPYLALRIMDSSGR